MATRTTKRRGNGPHKGWFDRCVSGVQASGGGASDPEAVCGSVLKRKRALAGNPGNKTLRALLEKMTKEQQDDLIRSIDRFYYAAMDEGFKPAEAQEFAEKRAIPQAKKILGKTGNPSRRDDFRKRGNELRRKAKQRGEDWRKHIYSWQAESDKAAAMADDKIREWHDLFEREFEKLHGHKPGPYDIRVSGVGDDRLPSTVKDALRVKVSDAQNWRDDARALWYAAYHQTRPGLPAHYLGLSERATPPRKRNPEDDSAGMYESFHGTPSTVVDEYEEKEVYHSNLAALGELIGLKVRTVSGYDVTLGFESGRGKGESNPSKVHTYLEAIRGSHYMGDDASTGLSSYHAAKAAVDAGRIKEPMKRLAAVRAALKSHRVTVTLDGDRVRVHQPDTGNTFYVGGKEGNPNRQSNLWPFDIHSRTTIYHVPSGHKFHTTTTHKGHTIYKSESKEGYVVPSIERESVFDTVKDAKKFIDAWTKHRNPKKGKGKHHRKSVGPFAASRQFVGDTVGAIYRPVDEFTGMVTGALDKGFGKVGIKGNPRKRNPDHALLTSNENGTQLYIVGGQQDLDLKALKIDGEAAKKDLVTVGQCWGICYRTTKKWSDKEVEADTEYIHIFGKKETKPKRGGDLWEDAVPPPDAAFYTDEIPVLMYDRLNEKQALVGGSYKIDRPLIGVSPGIEG